VKIDAGALARERGRAGLTQAALAERAGISRGALSRLENGRVGDARPRTLLGLAAALGADPGALVAWADRPDGAGAGPGAGPARGGRGGAARSKPPMPDSQAIDPDATYDLTRATRLKGVSPPTVLLAIRTGRLPATRGSRAWAIRGADLLAWRPYQRPPPPGWLTLDQAAAAVGFSRGAVRGAMARGRLPARWEAGRWFVAPADLAAWRARAEAEPPVGPLDPDGWYRMAEAAKLVGVTRQAVFNAVLDGRLRAAETAEGTRVRGSDLLAWKPRKATP
jgi:transcriptional regulator with XRE-family HTH domain